MKILVVGGVAAGTKAAAKLKRQDRALEVKILTKSTDISYAGCGLPYYVGGMIESRGELIVNSPEKYAGLTGAEDYYDVTGTLNFADFALMDTLPEIIGSTPQSWTLKATGT